MTVVFTPAVFHFTLVHVKACVSVRGEGVAAGAGTGVAAGGVDTLLLATVGPSLTFILVLAGARVGL